MEKFKKFYKCHKRAIHPVLIIFLVIAILVPVYLLFFAPTKVEMEARGLNAYSMTLTYDDSEKKLEGKQEISFQNKSNKNWDDIRFHLYPATYRQGAKYKPVSTLTEARAYPNGKSYGGIVINSVKSGSSEISFSVEGEDEDILVVEKLLLTGRKTSLVIDFTVTIPNINHRLGWGESTVNLANFYPILCMFEDDWVTESYSPNGDPFYSSMANYSVSFTRPTELILATTGEVTKTEKSESTTTTHINANAVRDFAMVLSSKFEVQTTKVGDIEISYYYYDDPQASVSLLAAADSIRTFSELFGKYPYKNYTVVKNNFVHGGMEYPNLVYISDEVTDAESYLNVIIHETAHQWWYQLVGNNAVKYGWLDEGLTEYSTAMFYEMNPSYGIDKNEILLSASRSYQMFVKVYGDVFGSVNTEMNRDLNDFITESEYVNIAYVKGMILFDCLRSFLGDKAFIKGLQYYFEENTFKIATPESLILCFERSCGRNLHGFFEAWINGKVILEDFN